MTKESNKHLNSLKGMIDPAIKEDPNYSIYNQMLEGSHFCTLPNSPKPFVASVWAGPSIFPDYTQPHTREWWGALYPTLFVYLFLFSF
jgi:alpha-glucosidase